MNILEGACCEAQKTLRNTRCPDCGKFHTTVIVHPLAGESVLSPKFPSICVRIPEGDGNHCPTFVCFAKKTISDTKASLMKLVNRLG